MEAPAQNEGKRYCGLRSKQVVKWDAAQLSVPTLAGHRKSVPQSGTAAAADVYREGGVPARRLAQRLRLGFEGRGLWDGPLDTGKGLAVRRIVILGNAGSGKSTLARELGARLGLPVAHLDVLFWQPGWGEPEADAFRASVARVVLGERWITEGNYSSRTFDLRIPRADTLIWMDTPRTTCMRRVIWRTLFQGRRADLAEGCKENILRGDFPDFVRFPWFFDRLARPRIEANLAAFPVVSRIVRLRSRRETTSFLQSVPTCP